MRYPQVYFALDTELDIWTCNFFLNYEEFTNFPDAILRVHPALSGFKSLPDQERSENYRKYVNDYYKKNQKEINKALEKTRSDWEGVSDRFYSAVDVLFGKHDGTPYKWPDGKYTGKLSIFNCNPRWIDTKTFQVYYMKPTGTNYTCMHEMLHFVFYDYVEKHFSSEVKKLGEDKVWKTSEIFNDVVFRQPEFVSITEREDPGVYAETREELIENLRLWSNSRGADGFIKTCFLNIIQS